MQFRTFSCFFVNLGLSVQTELEPSPAAPSHQNYRFLGLPGHTKQMQPYHLLDLSYRFPGQQRNHAALQLPECTYLLLPAKLTVTLNLLALLHLKYAATQHFRLSQSLISWLPPSALLRCHCSGGQWTSKNSDSLLICEVTRLCFQTSSRKLPWIRSQLASKAKELLEPYWVLLKFPSYHFF